MAGGDRGTVRPYTISGTDYFFPRQQHLLSPQQHRRSPVHYCDMFLQEAMNFDRHINDAGQFTPLLNSAFTLFGQFTPIVAGFLGLEPPNNLEHTVTAAVEVSTTRETFMALLLLLLYSSH